MRRMSRVPASLLLVVLLAMPARGIGSQQDRRIPTVGVLGEVPQFVQAFEQGLADLGWKKGQNFRLELRSAQGNLERLPALAAELVELNVDVILAASAPETAAARRATQRIPIVFAIHGDPVGSGHVASLAKPGGNITGFSQLHPDLIPKQFELLRQLVPQATRVGVIWNAANPTKATDWRESLAAAQRLGLVLASHELRSAADLEHVFLQIRQRRPDAMLILGDPVTFTLRSALTEFAQRERLPAMYPFRQFVDAGGLMSYGATLTDLYRRAAGHVDKILKGARPAELPVEQPTRFELLLNAKAARAIGVAFPASLQMRADATIE